MMMMIPTQFLQKEKLKNGGTAQPNFNFCDLLLPHSKHYFRRKMQYCVGSQLYGLSDISLHKRNKTKERVESLNDSNQKIDFEYQKL